MANCNFYDRGICQIGIANICPYRHGCNKPYMDIINKKIKAVEVK